MGFVFVRLRITGGFWLVNGQVADMLFSLSAAPTDRTVRTARIHDSQSSVGNRKGFPSVLERLREAGRQDDRRKDDSLSSTRRADERAQINGTKISDHSQARTEQSNSLTKRTESRPPTQETEPNNDRVPTRTKEGDLSSSQAVGDGSAQHAGSKPIDVSSSEDASSGKNNTADSVSSPHVEVFPVLTTLLTQPTDAIRSHQEPLFHEGDLRPLQGGEDHTTNILSESGAPSFETIHSSSTTAQILGSAQGQDGLGASLKARPQQPLPMSTSQTENGTHGEVSLAQDQPLVFDHAQVQKTTLSKNTDLIASNVAADSPGLTPDAFLQEDSRILPESMSKNSQGESPMPGSGHEGNDGQIARPLPVQLEGQSPVSDQYEVDSMKAEPMSLQGHQPALDLAKQFSDRWLSQHDQQADQADVKMMHTPSTASQSESGKLPDTLVVGAAGSVTHTVQPVSSSALGTVAQVQPSLSPPHLADQPMPAAMRTVVLSVAQPDLGQVHMRVALTNDIVHTHLSTDRADVGQFLLSGQDRLQISLQQSGFDMGQFRVDIDRQGAGRSFQQGSSQEQQGRAGNQDLPWTEGESTISSYDEAHRPMLRRLNVVA